ncbi:serine/threonine protein kinase, partial [Streptomyces anulatus]
PPSPPASGSQRATPPPPSAPASYAPVASPAAPVGAPKPATAATAASASVPGQRPSSSAASTRASITDVVPRRTLAIIAVVVALAILGTVLALTLGGDDADKGGGKGDTAASAGASSGGADDKGDDTGGGSAGEKGGGQKEGQGTDDGRASEDPAGDDADDSGADDPKDDGAEPGDALPAGYEKVTDARFHFTMAMPEGFKRTAIAGSNSGGIYNDKQGSFPRVQVDFNSSPKDDAAAAWRGAVASAKVLSDGYKHGGIKKVEYNGYPTVADWTFERNHNGVRVKVLNRGFKVDAGRGYSIMISCKVDEWEGDECRTLRETAFATFTPTG